MSKVTISVIIPTLNEEKYIGELLSRLARQSFQDFEVIVADANSTDSTREIAKKHGAKIVDGGRQAYGRNNGAKAARGELLLFLDADVSFYSNFLDKCYVDFVRLNADLACCYFVIKKLSLEMKFVYALWNMGKFLRRRSKFPDGEGQCLLVKKAAFDKIGGFDESLRISEDVDLIYRAIKTGYQYKVLPQGFIPSPRRYKKVGIPRVFLSTLISGIGQMLGQQRGKGLTELVYGGWGTHEGRR